MAQSHIQLHSVACAVYSAGRNRDAQRAKRAALDLVKDPEAHRDDIRDAVVDALMAARADGMNVPYRHAVGR